MLFLPSKFADVFEVSVAIESSHALKHVQFSLLQQPTEIGNRRWGFDHLLTIEVCRDNEVLKS